MGKFKKSYLILMLLGILLSFCHAGKTQIVAFDLEAQGLSDSDENAIARQFKAGLESTDRFQVASWLELDFVTGLRKALMDSLERYQDTTIHLGKAWFDTCAKLGVDGLVCASIERSPVMMDSIVLTEAYSLFVLAVDFIKRKKTNEFQKRYTGGIDGFLEIAVPNATKEITRLEWLPVTEQISLEDKLNKLAKKEKLAKHSAYFNDSVTYNLIVREGLSCNNNSFSIITNRRSPRNPHENKKAFLKSIIVSRQLLQIEGIASRFSLVDMAEKEMRLSVFHLCEDEVPESVGRQIKKPLYITIDVNLQKEENAFARSEFWVDGNAFLESMDSLEHSILVRELIKEFLLTWLGPIIEPVKRLLGKSSFLSIQAELTEKYPSTVVAIFVVLFVVIIAFTLWERRALPVIWLWLKKALISLLGVRREKEISAMSNTGQNQESSEEAGESKAVAMAGTKAEPAPNLFSPHPFIDPIAKREKLKEFLEDPKRRNFSIKLYKDRRMIQFWAVELMREKVRQLAPTEKIDVGKFLFEMAYETTGKYEVMEGCIVKLKDRNDGVISRWEFDELVRKTKTKTEKFISDFKRLLNSKIGVLYKSGAKPADVRADSSYCMKLFSTREKGGFEFHVFQEDIWVL